MFRWAISRYTCCQAVPFSLSFSHDAAAMMTTFFSCVLIPHILAGLVALNSVALLLVSRHLSDTPSYQECDLFGRRTPVDSHAPPMVILSRYMRTHIL